MTTFDVDAKIGEIRGLYLKDKETALRFVRKYEVPISIIAACFNVEVRKEIEYDEEVYTRCLVMALVDPRELSNRQRFNLYKAYHFIEIYFN